MRRRRSRLQWLTLVANDALQRLTSAHRRTLDASTVTEDGGDMDGVTVAVRPRATRKLTKADEEHLLKSAADGCCLLILAERLRVAGQEVVDLCGGWRLLQLHFLYTRTNASAGRRSPTFESESVADGRFRKQQATKGAGRIQSRGGTHKPVMFRATVFGRLRLIRFRGHLPKGGYDVPTDGRHEETPAATPAI